VQAALRTVPGVESAKVDFENKTATVTCNGNCDSAAMVAALKKAGYGASVR
jgi:copper chaperone CopZ